MTGPAKRDQVGTKYTISQNRKYPKFCIQYLLLEMFHINLFSDGIKFTSMASVYHLLSCLNMVKFNVYTYSIFTGPVVNILE